MGIKEEGIGKKRKVNIILRFSILIPLMLLLLVSLSLAYADTDLIPPIPSSVTYIDIGVEKAKQMLTETGLTVRINTPEGVCDKFTATIEIGEVEGLDSGQFDISFNASVVNITSVEDGMIDGCDIPVEMWTFMDKDTIRVLFNLPGVTGVSGSGYAAKTDFEVIGKEGDNSVLEISNGLLVDTEAKEIPASWAGAEITIKAAVPSLTHTTTPPLSPTPTPTSTPATTPKPPGFEAAFVIGGLLAVACLLCLKRKRC